MNSQKLVLPLMAAALWVAPTLVRGQAPLPQHPVAQTPREKARVAWYEAARFGLFVHWGLYTVPAGEWKGKTDYGEWFMYSTKMPTAEYALFAKQFDPQEFDPDAWVALARRAGMRYLVLTTKHHEGFSLWDSQANPFNVVSATPFHRDVVREVAQACRRGGIKFCVYFSDTDWRDPDFPAIYNPGGFHGAPVGVPNMDRYLTRTKAEMRELLTHYGPLGIFWFDNGGGFAGYDIGTVMHGQELVDLVHKYQPDCLVNNRAGIPGDYGTPEQEIPNEVSTTPWETCMTMNGHWGYNRADKDWKSASQLVFDLVDIASKGGNLLLNVGPTPQGTFPPEAVERLKAMGDWMSVNGASIHGTGPTPFGAELGSWTTDAAGNKIFAAQNNWRCTSGPGRLYLHLLVWPGSHFVLPGLGTRVKRAYLLADPKRQALPMTHEGQKLNLSLPAAPPDAMDSVVCLEVRP